MEKPHFFHFATDGLKDDILFASASEFIAGTNRIAICLLRLGPDHPVQVICFVLMDNHVHFILYGLEEDCMLFMEHFKLSTELWLHHHGRENGPGKRWQVGHWLIPDKERLRNTIAYIHRNPMAAGMAYTPSGYRWSSASLPFADTTFVTSFGKRVGSLSRNDQKRLFCSKTQVPGDWILLPGGMIWPGEFVKYQQMERQFNSAQDYQFLLNKRVEDDVNLEMRSAYISLPDGEIAARCHAMAEQLYGERNITHLKVQQRLSLARLLWKETGASAKQIARIVHLKLGEIEPILNPRKG